MQFDNPQGVTFEVTPETRTIRGLALPFGDIGETMGMRWTFGKGSLQWSKVKVLDGHDWTRAVGTAELEETDDGILMTAKIAKGSRGDDLLELCAAGVYDGLSIGLADDVKSVARNGVQHVKSGTVREVSLTPIAAFERASITSVAASATESNIMENTETREVEGTETAEVSAAPTFSLDDVRAVVTDVLKAQEPAPVVPAGRTDGYAMFAVTEEPMYRFRGAISGKHDFSQDLIAGVNGDAAAKARVLEFTKNNLLVGPRFVDTGDTAAINPTRNRPDMFLDEGPAQPTPLHNFFFKGSLADVTPFSYSKLDSYSGLVDDHEEGVEPTGGDFAVETGATVTPSAVSGKIFVTREVADQSGNPAVSGLIWSKFQREFNALLEAKTAELVLAGTYSSFITGSLSTGADGDVIGAALEDGLVALQFRADGSRFEKMFAHVDLYKKLVSATADDGRKLYPILNPMNADGTATSRFGTVNVAGMTVDPTWSLGTTSAGSGASAGRSIVADRNAVHVWNTGLTKLDKLEEKVAGFYVGAWAYWAGIRYDESGILKVDYDLS